MKILYASSEIVPFAATGGLGDVIGALPAVIKKNNEDWDVRAVMPLYSKISENYRAEMTFEKWIMVSVAWRRQYCGIFSLRKDGVTYYFIDNEYYFKRDSLYGCYDDGERFAFFSLAVMELMSTVEFYPDILSANDWQTALTVIYMKTRYAADTRYRDIKTLFTIHNIDYQGVYGKEILGDVFSLSESEYHLVEYKGCINLVKGAVVCADRVTTVSPNYARQIQSAEYAHGLEDIMAMYSGKLSGIVNGIDYTVYNPNTDTEIPFRFSAGGLSGKAKDKTELQRTFSLEKRPDVPVLAMVTRLAEHKGIDLVTRVIDEIMANDDIQFIILGTGNAEYENFFKGLSYRYKGRVAAAITFNRPLSKLIYAGADMFLMPSLSEACGLSQMIASRYGTVPIVRETGGLYDTIKPYTGENGNGFTFAAYNAHDMMYVIREAEALYRDKESWKTLVKRVMKTDFSWDKSSAEYACLYNGMLNK